MAEPEEGLIALDAPATPDATPVPEATAEAPARPENVPEKFWDTEAKAIRADAVLKSFLDQEKLVSKRWNSDLSEADKMAILELKREEFEKLYEEKRKGTVPEEYVIKPELKPDDPLAVTVLEWAKETGISQEAFDKLADRYIELSSKLVDATQKSIDERRAAIGPDYAKREKSLVDWVAGPNRDPNAIELLRSVRTPEQFLALEALMKRPPQERAIATNDHIPRPPEDELRELEDKHYGKPSWTTNDVQKKVSALYDRIASR